MATSKFNKVIQKNNITYTNLNMRNATNGFKTRKHEYRYAIKSLVGGSANKVPSDAYSAFRVKVAKLIPDTKAQKQVSSEEFNTPITINNTQFPNNIILYAFIIFYCLKVHNFKINTTEDGTKNKLLLTGLVDILIGVLKQMQYTNTKLIAFNKSITLSLPDDLLNILNTILHNGDITTNKALVTVNVKDYFTIDAQKKVLSFFGSQHKIKSIKINVEPKTNFLKSSVNITFNESLKTNLIIPRVGVATSSAKNDAPVSTNPSNVSIGSNLNVGLAKRTYDEISENINLDEIKQTLNTILSSMPIDSKDTTICHMFVNDAKNILLKKLIEIAFNKLIGENNNEQISKYYDAIKTILRKGIEFNPNSINDNDVKAYVYMLLLPLIININIYISMKQTFITDNKRINKFITRETLLTYIDNYYKDFTQILTKQKQTDEAYYKNAITNLIISINGINTDNNINKIHNNIALYIINLYLRKIRFCCIILYAIDRYNTSRILVDRELKDVPVLSVGDTLNAYGEVVPNNPAQSTRK